MANICIVKGYISVYKQENADKLFGIIKTELEKNNAKLDFGGNSVFWDTSADQEGCKIFTLSVISFYRSSTIKSIPF